LRFLNIYVCPVNRRSVYIFGLAILNLFACSSERNTWTSKAYHNTTAHYNGYFYAREEINKVEATIRSSHVDDFNRILRLYPTFDSALTKTFDKEIQEAIKMASIAIQRHPNSKWIDDAYILVGKARMYSLDWGNAIQTFKYTNKIGKDKDTRHLAIINLIRTYIEHHEFNNAKAAIDYLDKEKLNRENRKKFLMEKAYYYQLHNDYDNMVRSLTDASPLLKKADRRGRVYFIVGQVYQKLGFESEAFNFYKKTLTTNPEYEVDFYARLYMTQVTEISRNKDKDAVRKTFAKLLKDLKNKEFKDKIYYEMGVFELKQNNLPAAITNFKQSVRQGSNTRIDGEAFLRLGEIYYDTLRNYELSQAYYDSAIATLPLDYEGYAQIKTRQEILNEFVTHLKTIQWQDSLLELSAMDTSALRALVDSAVTKKKREEEARIAKNKKRANRISIDSNDNSSVFGNDDDGTGAATPSSDNTEWYFGNPSTLAVGQTEFARIWGNVPLEDNWRRSSRESNASALNVEDSAEDLAKNSDTSQGVVKEDPVEVELTRLNSEIPRTEESKAEALKKIEDAYFKLGEIYYFKLHENDNAVTAYKQLLTRFPDTSHEPEVLYTLYLILKDSDPASANQYASLLKSKHPATSFAKILVNPSYLQESSQAAEQQKELYKVAYEAFEQGKLKVSDSLLRRANALGETSFTPNLELLRVLLIGETEDISKYQYELDEFSKKYPENAAGKYAKTLLDKSREFQDVQEKRKGIQYIRSLEEPHYFVIVYDRKSKIDDLISTELEKFNSAYFGEHKLNISNLIFNDNSAIIFVSEIANVSTAIEYYHTFNEKLPAINALRNHKFDNFVITKDNFDIFYRTKGLDEYQKFFEKNYHPENP
jgi:tetratricopeptide (TPR) repeat protein